MAEATPAKISTPKLSTRLTTQDATFIYGESNSGALHIGSLSIFEGKLGFEQLVTHVERKLDLVPRYRQRLRFVPFNLAHAAWEDDPNFNISNHLFHHELPAGTSVEEMVKAGMEVYAPPLNRNRPVWEMHLYEGLEGDRSAVIWKVHHCMVDGVSGMELLAVIMDFRPDATPPPAPEKPWEPRPAAGLVKAILDAAFDLADRQMKAYREFADMLASRERLGPMLRGSARMIQSFARPIVNAPWSAAPVTQARSFVWVKLPFSDVRAIRAAIGGTVNDVVLAMLGEGAARYLKEHNVPTGGAPLRIGCPVNVRRPSEGGAMGNRVSMMFPETSSEPMDPVERLKSIAQETERIKTAREAQALEVVMTASDLVPPTLIGLGSLIMTTAMDAAARLVQLSPALARMMRLPALGMNFIATNVPGVQVPLYMCGHRMVEYAGLLPLAANVGYGVAITSYNQELYFGLMCEPNVLPDVELMKLYIEQVFQELKLAAARTKPAEPAIERVAVAAPARRASARKANVERQPHTAGDGARVSRPA